MRQTSFFRAAILSGLAVGMPFVAEAATGFTGDYAPGAALLSTGGGGSLDLSGAPDSITLIGGNNQDFLGSDQLYQFTASVSGVISFEWSYSSEDCCGATWDPFGYQLNGIFHALVDVTNGVDGLGAPIQGGAFSLAVIAGDTFAFDQNSVDDATGAATTIVSKFDGPVAGVGGVPEPASWALMIMGLGAAGAVLRRRHTRPQIQTI